MNRDDVKRQVQQATDVVRLIGEHVSLRPRGREFVGLCPFHDDKNPSMYVSPAKQIFKCFSCGAGGDVFSFMMDYHKLSFPEALQQLAENANIKLPESNPQTRGEADQPSGPSPREQILHANRTTLQFYRTLLRHEQHGEVARNYLVERGISEEMIEAFQIGYAPDRWDGLVQTIRTKGWPTEPFETAGLIGRKSGGNWYDRLRHRLIFPICDALGRPIAFGGRKLRAEDEPKYLNSPETAVFNKSATLFGLHLAKKAIIDQRTAAIVEGYTDVIACHQAGVTNVVATLGTALTAQHARELRRYCDRVILVFDGDEAGQKAADRALEVFFQEPIDLDIAILPAGQDPADLLSGPEGLERWQEAMGQARDAMAFHFDRMKQRMDQTPSLAGKLRLAEDYLRNLAHLGLGQLDLDPARRNMLIPRLADLLRLDVGTVNDMLRRMSQAGGRGRAGEPEAKPTTSENRLSALRGSEEQIVGCLLNRPSLFHTQLPNGRSFDESVLPAEFDDSPTRRIYWAVYDWLCETEQLDAADLRCVFEDEALLRLALDLKLEVDRAAESDDARIESMLLAAVAARERHLAEKSYLEQKMQLRQNEATTSDEERVARAIEHARAHPSSARRIPRIRT